MRLVNNNLVYLMNWVWKKLTPLLSQTQQDWQLWHSHECCSFSPKLSQIDCRQWRWTERNVKFEIVFRFRLQIKWKICEENESRANHTWMINECLLWIVILTRKDAIPFLVANKMSRNSRKWFRKLTSGATVLFTVHKAVRFVILFAMVTTLLHNRTIFSSKSFVRQIWIGLSALRYWIWWIEWYFRFLKWFFHSKWIEYKTKSATKCLP